MRCAIWYHLYNWKIVKNTHGGALRLVKLHSTVGVFHDFSIVQMYQVAQSIKYMWSCKILKKTRPGLIVGCKIQLPRKKGNFIAHIFYFYVFWITNGGIPNTFRVHWAYTTIRIYSV